MVLEESENFKVSTEKKDKQAFNLHLLRESIVFVDQFMEINPAVVLLMTEKAVIFGDGNKNYN